MSLADLAPIVALALPAVAFFRWIAAEEGRQRRTAERARIADRRPFPILAVRIIPPENEETAGPEGPTVALGSPTSPKEQGT